MPLAHDSLSRVIFFTMPGPPKSPVMHVTDLKHREVRCLLCCHNYDQSSSSTSLSSSKVESLRNNFNMRH